MERERLQVSEKERQCDKHGERYFDSSTEGKDKGCKWQRGRERLKRERETKRKRVRDRDRMREREI